MIWGGSVPVKLLVFYLHMIAGPVSVSTGTNAGSPPCYGSWLVLPTGFKPSFF
jgi:hypothetical protein